MTGCRLFSELSMQTHICVITFSEVSGPETRVETMSVPRPVAIPVGRALPHANRGQMGRLGRGDQPLVDGIVGDAVQPDLAVAPELRRHPLDRVVEILDLARRQQVELAGAAPGPASVDAE